MNAHTSHRRFKSNPIELIIFLITSAIFINSVYHILYDHSDFTAAALTPMNSNPISEGGRQLASFSSPIATLDIPCDEAQKKETHATKLRLKGILCGWSPKMGNATLAKASIINTANQYSATVFTETESGKFSTDYIPLSTGENIIKFEFTYKNGKTISQTMSIVLRGLL